MQPLEPPVVPPRTILPPVAAPPEPEPLVPLDQIPVPTYVKALVVLAAIALVIGIARFPAAVADGVMYERSQRYIVAGKPMDAEPLLMKLKAKYPEAKDVTFDLMETYLANKKFKELQALLLPFNGAKVSKREEARLTAIEQQFMRETAREEKEK